MNQRQAPILDALAAIEKQSIVGFGAPGHSGVALPGGTKRLVGAQAFKADILTPKGLDDRTEGGHVLQRAHELAAEAWGADFCRFVTGGSTQSLHTAIGALARPGDTILLAQNAHKAEWAYALLAGLTVVPLAVAYDPGWDIEHGVSVDTLRTALDAHPEAKAVVIVSPSYYGVTSDVARLARLCHDRGVPLVVDAAWGGAFTFSPRLPADALAQGADLMVASLHKTMGALAQGSVVLARGQLVDRQRLWLAYELFETTSPSVAILASLDATRRDHATNGAAIWDDVLDMAAEARRELAAIPGVRVFGPGDLPPHAELDASKVLLDISALGVAGFAVDDWLYREHKVSVGLSDARHLLLVISIGTTRADVRALVRALGDCVTRLGADPAMLPRAPAVVPVADLPFAMAMPGPDAFFAPVEMVAYEDAGGRIAAEIVAPAPPGVPRLVPGQRITAAHVAFLIASRDAGAFILDPTDPSQRMIRVVAGR